MDPEHAALENRVNRLARDIATTRDTVGDELESLKKRMTKLEDSLASSGVSRTPVPAPAPAPASAPAPAPAPAPVTVHARPPSIVEPDYAGVTDPFLSPGEIDVVGDTPHSENGEVSQEAEPLEKPGRLRGLLASVRTPPRPHPTAPSAAIPVDSTKVTKRRRWPLAIAGAMLAILGLAIISLVGPSVFRLAGVAFIILGIIFILLGMTVKTITAGILHKRTVSDPDEDMLSKAPTREAVLRRASKDSVTGEKERRVGR